jgi:hypothetical protein
MLVENLSSVNFVHIGIKMRPSDDNEEFVHNIIREGTHQHPTPSKMTHPKMIAANISMILAMAMLSS